MIFKYIWVKLNKKPDEAIFLFKNNVKNRETISFASNYPYEVYLDDNYYSDGGFRCPDREAYIDTIKDFKGEITIRMHWMNAKSSNIWNRCLFNDPFFAHDEKTKNWTCELDSVTMMAKPNSQLPRQNLLIPTGPYAPLMLESVVRNWNLIPLPILAPKFIPIQLKKFNEQILDKLTDNDTVKDLLLFATQQRPYPMKVVTYDLGYIALHRFEIENNSNSMIILAYSEVESFDKAWATKNRAKVHLADASTYNGISRLFGCRGCRYVHVISSLDNIDYKINVFRREYPFDWNEFELPREQAMIIDACKNNLIACTDGGIVDTCWRERAQWVGDARMSIMALDKLTKNKEIGQFVLGQISKSYRDGYVSGVTPTKNTKYFCKMPPYHLAFCLTVIESKCSDPFVTNLVKQSMEYWKENFVGADGLLTGLTGWNFIDWDFTNRSTCGWVDGEQGVGIQLPNAVCHAWFLEICDHLKIPHGISMPNFLATFYTGEGFSLLPNTPSNIHATAAILSSGLNITESMKESSYKYLNKMRPEFKKCMTPYFAYFVAKAYMLLNRDLGVKFIEEYYLDIVKKHGTIQEKCNDEASLAHGWSVGIAALLV
ncbi:MAG: alpha-L-rhamnosidase [Hyperionvirus sp.]|uniref:Alpha-L-rhamnosidase n=1 Tax=Hyperionvirus sp. TaxID=2487770 RepID=A0A3G5ABL2_9VIRU|nr:MAG: alpha-L-rhamnosidase [Hyperionvirus sp.]